jgi:hypothetical protein
LVAVPITQAIQWRLLTYQSAWAVLLYLLLLAAAAASASIFGGKEPALVAWIAGTLGLFAVLLRTARRASALGGTAIGNILIGACIGIGVALLAFFGFVMMVNVWELLGLGH